MNADYLSLPADELAAEPALQAYALDGRDAEAWATWLAAHPEAAPRVNDALATVRRLAGAYAEAPPADGARVEALWRRIDASTRGATSTRGAAPAKVVRLADAAPVPARPRRPRRVLLWAVTAAAAAIALLLYVSAADDVYRTDAGEQRVVVLADGSRVTLGPASALAVEDYGADERRLRLTGEAFFEVQKGRPFSVATAAGSVRVLGTSFSVDVGGERHLAVACATGRVRVEVPAGSTELTPGQAVRRRGDTLAPVYAVPAEEVGDARRGRIHFRDATVGEVADRLRRYYGRTFTPSPASRDLTVNLELPTGDFPGAIARVNFVLATPVDTSAVAD